MAILVFLEGGFDPKIRKLKKNDPDLIFNWEKLVSNEKREREA